MRGEAGLLEIIKQLQGVEIAASAWEKYIFPVRVLDYTSDMLDKLCLSGVIGWGRFSSPLHKEAQKKIVPTRKSPITFFLRETGTGFAPAWVEDIIVAKLSHIAKDIYLFLKLQGASIVTFLKT